MVNEETGGRTTRQSVLAVLAEAGYTLGPSSMYLVEDYIDQLDEYIEAGGLDDFAEADGLFRVLVAFAYAASGAKSVPREFWDRDYLASREVAERHWLPWLSGFFGLGDVVRAKGAGDHVGKCVGIRAGRVILEFPDGSQATLSPSSVEGRVDP